ncbi:hypothetical protein STIB_40120 [Streptomyces sp. IB2014 011-1]|nr:hypothetical protein STIB_40120 [Streptomyces sp. IB2014 011-1]
MSVVGDGMERGDAGVDKPGWEVDPDDEPGAAVVADVGRQTKAWREAAGMRAAEFGTAMGYSEDLIYKVEGGRRIPRPEFMEGADGVLGAEGKLAAMKADIAEVRYPKKIRDLARLEARAVELAAYGSHNLHGLLQTRSTRGRCSVRDDRSCPRTSWSVLWPDAWPGNPSSAELPHPNSASSRKRPRCAVRSAAWRCGGDSSKTCFAWASRPSWISR